MVRILLLFLLIIFRDGVQVLLLPPKKRGHHLVVSINYGIMTFYTISIQSLLMKVLNSFQKQLMLETKSRQLCTDASARVCSSPSSPTWILVQHKKKLVRRCGSINQCKRFSR